MSRKPVCPYCEGEPRLEREQTSIYVLENYIVCEDCEERTGLYDTEQGAWKAWSTRTFSERERALVKASKRAEVMMDTCALLGIGDWLQGQYREDWATIHTELITALAKARG